jgi:tetratricopeptide (TPR) repeat protein
MPNPSDTAFDGSEANNELAAAQRMIRAGDYSSVITRLKPIVEKYPSTPAGIEARHFLGLAYYQIGGYRDAMSYFEDYLKLAPTGKYAELSRQYVASLTDEGRKKRQTQDLVESRGAELQNKIAQDPRDLASQLELADLYWKNSQYKEAGDVYAKALAQWPNLQNDVTIRQRMAPAPGGGFTVQSPAEVLRKNAEADPLVLFNMRTFHSGRSGPAVTAQLKDYVYNVSGQVANRGSETLHNVQVIVTIYGFGSIVYDAPTYNIGTLKPNETRVFSVQSTNFDNIDNVDRYECTTTYDR